jgi:hypothetical protein
MEILKGVFLIMLIIGIILIIIYYFSNNIIGNNSEPKIIYKYIPRTLEEEETQPIYVSQIFKTMFTQPSVWINSIEDDYFRKQEDINKYFISQA